VEITGTIDVDEELFWTKIDNVIDEKLEDMRQETMLLDSDEAIENQLYAVMRRYIDTPRASVANCPTLIAFEECVVKAITDNKEWIGHENNVRNG